MVSTVNGEKATVKHGKPHGVRYPWHLWFANRRITLQKGRDFWGLPHGFARTAQQAAARMGHRISTQIDEQSVTLVVY